jgi:flagellar motility protein MotE (MotC chaperone)
MEIQLAQIIFQILNFGVVLAALTYFVYKPVVKLLDERKAKIAQAAKSADEIQKEKEQLEETKTDLLRKDGRPLAFFNDKCMYSPLGMFIWMDFWAAGANFGPLSKILHASNRAAIAELAEEDFML